MSTQTVTTLVEPKQKKHYMLHRPDTYERLGRYVGKGYREAALKAASKLRTRDDLKGMDHFVMRLMGTKHCSKFEWSIKELETPRVVKKKDREIVYRFNPIVRKLSEFTMDDMEPDDSE